MIWTGTRVFEHCWTLHVQLHLKSLRNTLATFDDLCHLGLLMLGGSRWGIMQDENTTVVVLKNPEVLAIERPNLSTVTDPHPFPLVLPQMGTALWIWLYKL